MIYLKLNQKYKNQKRAKMFLKGHKYNTYINLELCEGGGGARGKGNKRWTDGRTDRQTAERARGHGLHM